MSNEIRTRLLPLIYHANSNKHTHQTTAKLSIADRFLLVCQIERVNTRGSARGFNWPTLSLSICHGLSVCLTGERQGEIERERDGALLPHGSLLVTSVSSRLSPPFVGSALAMPKQWPCKERMRHIPALSEYNIRPICKPMSKYYPESRPVS